MTFNFVEQVVRRLRSSSSFSRNRHFHTLSSPEGRLALRISRHLHAVEQDLLTGKLVEISGEDKRVRMVIAVRGGRRAAYLDKLAWKLLLESRPDLKSRLS